MDKAERLMRTVVDACTDCDICRHLMDANCLFFPEIYKQWDREQETGLQMTSRQLRRLADLCNYCALCPCPNIREDIIAAKTLFIDRDGLNPGIRTLEDVERVGKWCGAIPRISNLFLQNKISSALLKKAAGIDPRRKFPKFPDENFPSFAKRFRLNEKPPADDRRKVAYFAGCTARHLFPDVPKAAVEVLRRNHITVYYPEQICCGMPSMLEGDRKSTLGFAGQTISQLAEVVADGYDILCSCPTCHLREQGIGMPYLELLASIPAMSMDAIQSTAYCCGIGGIMGFKRDFHNDSIQMGSRLMATIRQLNPDRLITDCLSCRLQFNQMSDYPVQHPIEILAEAMDGERL